MDLPDHKTFCVAPWFQIRNNTDGSKSVCCKAKSNHSASANQEPLEFLNSDPVINLKKQLHRGERADECIKCWNAEDTGRISLRQKLNGVLTNNSSSIEKTWLTTYFKHKDNFKSEDLLMADIKIGNTCNYACVMCIPDDSSMIYNEWRKKPNAFFIKKKMQDDPEYLDRIKQNGFKNQYYKNYVSKVLANKRLKYLKLLGGEPLLDQSLLANLRALPEEKKKNISLFFTTNASNNLLEARRYLGNFKSIMFGVSLEGIGQVQEYARYGSNWSTVSANILQYKKEFPADISIHTTLQTTSILGLKELVEWTRKHKLALDLGLCEQPDYLSFRSLPNSVRQQVRESLSNGQITMSQRTLGDEELWSVEKILYTMENTAFDQELHDQFVSYIKWYEEGKDIPSLKNIFPSLFIDRETQIIYNKEMKSTNDIHSK